MEVVEFSFLKDYRLGPHFRKKSCGCNVDLWELWDKERYEELMREDWDGFDQPAQDVMGDSTDGE